MFRQRFENGAHIANRHFFIEQILQHFMQLVVLSNLELSDNRHIRMTATIGGK